jgi:hypothetical protein
VGLRAGLDTAARGKILRLCRGSRPGRPTVCSDTAYAGKYLCVPLCYTVLLPESLTTLTIDVSRPWMSVV